jgi:hypothetical protein
MKACIVLGGGLRLTPKVYLAALRLAEANPDMEFKQSFRDSRGWMGPSTGSQIVRQHYEMVRDRLNDRTMAQFKYGKGRKAARRAQAVKDR